MKKNLIQLTCLFTSVIIFFACNKENTENEQTITSIQVQVDKTRIMADGISTVQITALSQDNNNITEKCTFFADEQQITGNTFKTYKSAFYRIKAKIDALESTDIDIGAIESNNLVIESNVLIEEFTGTWCGWCPSVADKIDQAVQTSKRFIPIAIHVGDPMAIQNAATIVSSFGIQAYPSARINRNTTWDENISSLSLHLNNTANVKIGIETNISGSNATIKAKLQFNNALAANYNLCFYITEDNIVATQANYYTDGRGNPIANFSHKHVLRHTGSDFLGTSVQAEKITLKGEYEQTVTISLPSTWDKENCTAVVFVTQQNNNSVVNVQKVKLGNSVI